ncbi:MAG: hypothetical protein K2X47_13495 [Bdellovibrionales bacterium]|nr:hypothetical protein [Bdellovibrionales bacterium]
MSPNTWSSALPLLIATTVLFSGARAAAECSVYRNGRKEPCSFLRPGKTSQAAKPSRASVPSAHGIPPVESAGNAIAAALYKVQPVAVAARSGALKKLIVSPDAPVMSLRFSSTKEFFSVWRSDARTFLEAAFIGLQQDDPKIRALWDGKRRRLSAMETRFAQELIPSLTETSVALAKRIQLMTINLIPSQNFCGSRVAAFVSAHSVNMNQMNACPAMTTSNWQEALQTTIHEAAHLELNSGNECLVTAIEYSLALAAGFTPIQNGYQKVCGF